MAHLFTKQEIRGIALLLPIVVVGVWILVEALDPRVSREEVEVTPQAVVATTEATAKESPSESAPKLRPFDPNTVSYEELRDMGVEKFVARGIVKYRSTGRTYSIPEDVAIIYGVSDSLYAALKPYISIGEEYRPKQRESQQPAFTSTPAKSSSARRREFRNIPFDPNALTAEGFYELGCFSARQASAMVEYRDRLGGFRNRLEFADCYLIDSALYAQMEPYITMQEETPKPKTSAPRERKFRNVQFDPNTLTAEGFYELGCFSARQASAIVEYRDRLGGFRNRLEFADCYLIDSALYAQMEPYITMQEEAPKPKTSAPRERKFRNVQFDPNTLTAEGFYELGCFSARQASAIVEYRDRLGGFRNRLEFADCYLIDSALYAQMEPYITMQEEAPKPKTSAPRERKFRNVQFDPNTLTAEGFYELGCFSARQASAIVEYRDRRGGFRSELEWRDCYLIDSALYAQTLPYLRLSPVPKKLTELNGADSLALVAVPGVGPRTAHDIMLYRERLGGFHSVAQLLDLKVVTKENYELMKEEFWCDSCKIRKIDINFAPPKELAVHPYITTPRLRKILKQRQTKGGWKGLEEFLSDDIFTAEEREKLAPYFRFTSVVIE